MTTRKLLSATDPGLSWRSDLEVAVGQISGAELATPEAEAARLETLAFVAGHPDAAERSCVEGHLTASALVVDATGQRTLLMLHRKLGRWLQPGGHADGDANLAAVALKEATEETGIEGLRVAVPAIDIDVHLVEPPGEAAHLHYDVRHLVVAPPGAVEVANEESLALRWIEPGRVDELDPPLDERTRRLVAVGLEVARSLDAG